jgi:hypothetical protein
MAKKNNGIGDNHTIAEPDFETAANLIKGDIRETKGENSKCQGDLSALWKQVEKCHVDKSAAKVCAKLAVMAPGMQSTWLRTFAGLMPLLNIAVDRDLVDAAQGVQEFAIPIREVESADL